MATLPKVEDRSPLLGEALALLDAGKLDGGKVHSEGGLVDGERRIFVLVCADETAEQLRDVLTPVSVVRTLDN